MAERHLPMTAAQARDLVTKHDPEWDMPTSWWSIDSGPLSINVSEEVALSIIDGSAKCTHTSIADPGARYKFIDLYGSLVYFPCLPTPMIFRSTLLARAKWIVGFPIRNWKADEPDDAPNPSPAPVKPTRMLKMDRKKD